jgi:hypothetical protein
MGEIITHRGILYDARVVDVCVEIIRSKEFEFM